MVGSIFGCLLSYVQSLDRMLAGPHPRFFRAFGERRFACFRFRWEPHIGDRDDPRLALVEEGGIEVMHAMISADSVDDFDLIRSRSVFPIGTIRELNIATMSADGECVVDKELEKFLTKFIDYVNEAQAFDEAQPDSPLLVFDRGEPDAPKNSVTRPIINVDRKILQGGDDGP